MSALADVLALDPAGAALAAVVVVVGLVSRDRRPVTVVFPAVAVAAGAAWLPLVAWCGWVISSPIRAGSPERPGAPPAGSPDASTGDGPDGSGGDASVGVRGEHALARSLGALAEAAGLAVLGAVAVDAASVDLPWVGASSGTVPGWAVPAFGSALAARVLILTNRDPTGLVMLLALGTRLVASAPDPAWEGSAALVAFAVVAAWAGALPGAAGLAALGAAGLDGSLVFDGVVLATWTATGAVAAGLLAPVAPALPAFASAPGRRRLRRSIGSPVRGAPVAGVAGAVAMAFLGSALLAVPAEREPGVLVVAVGVLVVGALGAGSLWSATAATPAPSSSPGTRGARMVVGAGIGVAMAAVAWVAPRSVVEALAPDAITRGAEVALRVGEGLLVPAGFAAAATLVIVVGGTRFSRSSA